MKTIHRESGVDPVDVTVVVTAYNQRRTLPVALRCLSKQVFNGSWELILCDDGSEQDTLDILRQEFAELTDIPSRYIWQRRKGERRAVTRNNGLQCARGQLIVFLDGDIAVGSDFLARHVSLHSDKLSVVCGTRSWIFLHDLSKDAPLERVVQLLLSRGDRQGLLYSDISFQESMVATSYPWLACIACNMSFVRGGSEAVLFDEAFVGWGCEDAEFACRLCVQHGYEFMLSNAIDVIHMHDGSAKNLAPGPIRPNTSFEIEQYLRNILHFCNCYPELDPCVICRPLGFFEFSARAAAWRRASIPCFERRHLLSVLADVRTHLHDRMATQTGKRQ